MLHRAEEGERVSRLADRRMSRSGKWVLASRAWLIAVGYRPGRGAANPDELQRRTATLGNTRLQGHRERFGRLLAERVGGLDDARPGGGQLDAERPNARAGGC